MSKPGKYVTGRPDDTGLPPASLLRDERRRWRDHLHDEGLIVGHLVVEECDHTLPMPVAPPAGERYYTVSAFAAEVRDVATPNDRAILDRLGQLYWDEMTRYLIARPGEDGRYDLPFLGDDVSSSLLLVDDSPAGFITVSSGDSGHRMDEMFVLGVHRQRGLGCALARHRIARQPGRWTLSCSWRNVTAESFWRRTLSPYDPVERTTGRTLTFEWMASTSTEERRSRDRESY